MATTTYVPPRARRDSAIDGRNGGSGGGQGSVFILPSQVAPSQTGIWVAIAGIAMMFAALTSAMVVRHGAAGDWGHFRLPRILYSNTLILVLSSISLELSRRRFARDPDFVRDGLTETTRASVQAQRWFYLTMTLGFIFLCGQLFAWRQLADQGLFLSTLPSSSFFYLLTAVHGVHLLGGIVGLAYVLFGLRRNSGPWRKAAVSAASVYWHFMDGLWVYLMLLMIRQWN
jgi:cytochrome c oxidase subunit III